MPKIEWYQEPDLTDPLVLIGLSGWSDASNAASGAVEYLLGQTDDMSLLAEIPPEDYFDFTQARPEILVSEGVPRDLAWPGTSIYAIRPQGFDRDVIIVAGEEPHLKWGTYSETLIDVFHEIGASDIVLFGAFIGRVAHTLPVPLMAVASNPEFLREHQLMATEYQGPTGIVGVLNRLTIQAGFSSIALWVAVPHYLASNPNPRASLALLSSTAEIFGTPLDLTELEQTAIAFHQQVDLAMSESADLAEYVAGLEDSADELIMEPDAGDQLVDEIERFLHDPE